jgi:hypothetical protein
MSAKVAADQNDVAGADGFRTDCVWCDDYSDTRGVDEDSVALPLVYDLGVASHDRHVGNERCVAHGFDHVTEGLHRQPLFQHETGAERDRLRTAHGKVIDGAVDGKVPDGPTGEDKWLHNVGVGCHGKPGAADGKQGAIVPPVQRWVRESRKKDVFDKLIGKPTTATMGKKDAVSGWSR